MSSRFLHGAFVLVTLLAGSLLGQQQAHVSGIIEDPSGASVGGADISVVSHDTGFRRVTRSSPDGWYVVATLQPGLYNITVRKEGFRTLIRYGIKLDVAQAARVDLELEIGSVQEVITVTGPPPVVDTQDATVGTLVSRERIERLPLNGRGLISLVEFAPGTVATPATRGEPGQFTVNGQRPNTNNFHVDGVSANTGVSGGGQPAQPTGGSLPGMTAIGSLHGLISLEALKEFRVLTANSSPEFGKLPGAQVILSSQSGSNQFHGSAFHYFRHGWLDANNWFANRNGTDADPLRLNNFGATLGGPLRRNRTFFFASYEGMRLKEPFASQSAVPTQTARETLPEWIQPLVRLLPEANGRELGPDLALWQGQYSRTSGFDVAGLRIDHSVSQRLTLFGRYNIASSSNAFTTTQMNDLRIDSQSVTLAATVRVRPFAIFDFRWNYSVANGRSDWRPATELGPCYLAPVLTEILREEDVCDQLVRLSISGVGEVVIGPEADQRQTQWQVLPSLTITSGPHQVRLGMDHRRYAPQRRDRGGSVSLIAEQFSDLRNRSRLWQATADPYALRSSLSEYSGYVQDTWQVDPRLTATFGLRLEYTRPPELTSLDPDVDPPEPFLFEDQTEIWRGEQTRFAVRAGAALRLQRNGRTVLRGGWGRFFDSSLSIATDLVNSGPLTMSRYTSGKNAPFSTLLRYAFAPGLRLPSVSQWNVTVEREIRIGEALSVGYVGSSGRDLLRREFGGFEGSQTLWLATATNNGASSYHALELQYRRSMKRGVQALASYTWSHSIDNSSSDSLLHRVDTGLSARDDRGPSDFDVRHAITVALTFAAPQPPPAFPLRRFWSDWELDTIFRARSAFPLTLLNSEYSMGLSFTNAYRPHMVPGGQLWIEDGAAPGGRRLNPEALVPATNNTQGSLGRNAVRGFGMHQVDLAVRREFPLGDQPLLELRFEAFNLLNHPNFGDPTPYLSNPLFGESPATLNLMLGTGSPGSGLTPALQTGGPRSIQAVLRLRF